MHIIKRMGKDAMTDKAGISLKGENNAEFYFGN